MASAPFSRRFRDLIRVSKAFESSGFELSKLTLIPNFVTSHQEQQLMEEADKRLKRLKYERDHWDDAIVAYREFESDKWSQQSAEVIESVKQTAQFENPPRRLVHVLDIEAAGYIKPHIDSDRYCGDKVAGVSLLSDCVMRLVHESDKEVSVSLLLPRLSLYVLSHEFRYHFTHEILGHDQSLFDGQSVPRERRVSIICRSEPAKPTQPPL